MVGAKVEALARDRKLLESRIGLWSQAIWRNGTSATKFDDGTRRVPQVELEGEHADERERESGGNHVAQGVWRAWTRSEVQRMTYIFHLDIRHETLIRSRSLHFGLFGHLESKRPKKPTDAPASSNSSNLQRLFFSLHNALLSSGRAYQRHIRYLCWIAGFASDSASLVLFFRQC